MMQHILGVSLATYLIGFSVSYWRSLDRHLHPLAQSPDRPQNWRSGVGLILRLIPSELLWFMPRRGSRPQAAQDSQGDR